MYGFAGRQKITCTLAPGLALYSMAHVRRRAFRPFTGRRRAALAARICAALGDEHEMNEHILSYT